MLLPRGVWRRRQSGLREQSQDCEQSPILHVRVLVHLTKGRGLDPHLQYLCVRREIPAGTLFTVSGGDYDSNSDAGEDIQVILTDSHPSAQHGGEEKFQYSVRVGIDGLPGSSTWLVPRNDFPLLRLLGKDHRELKALTVEGRATAGLGQYAQQTCCFVHVNVHLFPLFILREEGDGVFKTGKDEGDGDWMKLLGVALRAE